MRKKKRKCAVCGHVYLLERFPRYYSNRLQKTIRAYVCKECAMDKIREDFIGARRKGGTCSIGWR